MAYVAVISLAQTLEPLVQRKSHLISDETRKMLDSILDSLEYFQTFLKNTSKRRQHNGEVDRLERDIETVVNKAEDLIELRIYEMYNETMGRKALSKTFLITLVEKIDTLKREVMECRFGEDEVLNETAKRKPLRKILPSLVEKNDVVKREVMRSHFGTNEVQGYGDPTNEDWRTGDSLPRHSTTHVTKLNPENIIVGLEEDLMRIKIRLKGPMSTREIVPILGMGGIGKTTLARKAYDDPEIRNRFDIHVWVTVSQEYHVRDLLLGVVSCISQLTNKTKEEMTNDQLMDFIYKKLKCRRYLVVMDDIWSNDAWDLMSRTFPDDNNSSRVILTSRLKDVAMHVDPETAPHEMRLLNLDESWNLLHDKVFGLQQVCPSELEHIGKQVAQRCQGLPLTLLVVGGHLSKISKTRESWKDVAKSVCNESADECLQVLAMSYNYLPHHLKPCFLYMGIFPEDMEVNVKRLINLWVSEGFMSEELVGRDYLEDLVSRNLLVVRQRRFNGEWKSCGVHDLVRDLILREAEKEKFLQITIRNVHAATNRRLAKKLHVRRYSCHSYINDYGDSWKSSSSSSSSSIDLTRTMHFFHGSDRVLSLLERFKLLRVLAVLDHEFHHFPLEITKLVHLRYLEFYCKDDSKIHQELVLLELYNLHTFIFGCLGASKRATIPPGIWQIKHLRHLHVSGFCSFPAPVSNSKLQNLEELSHLALTSCTSELFSALPNLKKLKIHAEMWVECEGGKYSRHVNDLSCLKKLEILKIKCEKPYIYRVPRNFVLPTSLKKLTLRRTHLPWEDMANVIALLPTLAELKIKHHGFFGNEWRLNDGEIFNQLQFLLIDMTELNHWKAGSVNFPKLKRLVLKRCNRLEEIPQDFGEICTLESIELHDCKRSAAKSVKEIQQEQESMGNDCLSVLINGYCWEPINLNRSIKHSRFVPGPQGDRPIDGR